MSQQRRRNINKNRTAQPTPQRRPRARSTQGAALLAAQEALGASEARFRALFEQAAVGIILVAPDNTLLAVNPGFCAIVGYSPDEALKLSPADITHPDDLAWDAARAEQAFAQREASSSVEKRYIRKDGSTVWVKLTRSLVYTPEGVLSYRLALIEDISARKAAEAQQAELLAQAQEAVAMRDAFLSLASHELRTPLTSLLGNVQLLERRAAREGLLNERDERTLAIIGQQAMRVNVLLDDLLDISRIERGQLQIERVPIDLVALVRRATEELQPSMSSHTLTCTAPAGPVMVLGDTVRLLQVLTNLISNAVKYSPDGGPVVVVMECRGAEAAITVTDKGIGIPAAALPLLFRRFYRAANVSGQRSFSGNGIGLFVVKEIVTLHGGSVAVESREGEGSSFTVTLPLLG